MPPKSTPLLSKPKFTPKTPAPTKKPPTGPQATDTDKGINATPAQKKARANAKADRKANGINFMVFCDGTGNNALDDEKTKTNVHRLFNCVGNLAPAQAGDAVGAGVEEVWTVFVLAEDLVLINGYRTRRTKMKIPYLQSNSQKLQMPNQKISRLM